RDIRDLHSFPTRRSSDLRSSLFQRATGQLGGRAELGKRSAAVKSRSVGDVRSHAAAVTQKTPSTSLAGGAGEAAGKHSRRGSGADRKSTRLNSSHVKISY